MEAIIRKDGQFYLASLDDECAVIEKISDPIPSGLVPIFADQEQARWQELYERIPIRRLDVPFEWADEEMVRCSEWLV